MKMAQTFPLLWEIIPRSHKRKALGKALASLESRMEKKKVALSTLLLLKRGIKY